MNGYNNAVIFSEANFSEFARSPLKFCGTRFGSYE
jgi:hypothetical protein